MLKAVQKTIQAFFKGEDGAAAVEFGIIAMVFLTLLFGIIEVSRLMWTLNSLQYASENASRFVIVNEDAPTDDIIQVITNSLQDMHIDPEMMTATITFYTENNVDFVEIDTTYTFNTVVLGFFPDVFNSFDVSTAISRPLVWDEG